MAVVDSASYKTLGIEASADVWLIEFYSDMCGSCKEFKPTFVQLANGKSHASLPTSPSQGLTVFMCMLAAFDGSVKGGACNIDTDAGMALANQLGVLNGAQQDVRTLQVPAATSG
jgi:hypothetical protein